MNYIEYPKRLKISSRFDDYIECRYEGLDEEEISANRAKYGSNVLKRKKTDSFLKQLAVSFNDPIIKILIIALIINAVISFGHINIAETLGIVTAILIATMVSTCSEYSSSLAYVRLCQSQSSNKCLVRRSGKVQSLSLSEICVGDRVLLTQGMAIPADGILVDGELYVDQASLTGETREIRKSSSNINSVDPHSLEYNLHDVNLIFKGSTILKGNGEMTALRVGERTYIGEIAGNLQEKPRPSPLKHRLTGLAKSIGAMGYIGAILIAFAYLFNVFFIESNMDINLVTAKLTDTRYLASEIIHAFTLAISVVVVAVPEGLPMMITVILSSNLKKMLRDGVLIRRLVGIETAGNINILFTDKTGTLTTGRMKVCKIEGCDFNKDVVSSSDTIPNFDLITKCISSACNPYQSSTDKALCSFAFKRINIVDKDPFDSTKKYSAGLSDEGVVYYVGAPEVLLAFCSFAYDSDGRLVKLDNIMKKNIERRQFEISSEACRVICLACKRINSSNIKNKTLPIDMEFICLIGIKDPVRKEAYRCVKDCVSAGIQVVMVTGDNQYTATAIAKETGIMTNERNMLLTSENMQKMTDEELSKVLPKLSVVSRALPSDKMRLVKLSEKRGKVVGMTGDGINDASALKIADVGFAMGSGTDIAKEAGDIVITDDSFSSITKAILYGRTIFHSIRKFIVFQLLMNLSAMGISLIGPFIGIESPVTVIQMLWINIIMDTLGGLAFAGEPALRKYMLRSSPPRDEKLVNKKMLGQILITGAYTLGLGIFFLKSPLTRSVFGFNDVYYLTAFFAMFIFCGIFNSFNVRTESVNLLSHIAGNKPFVFIMTFVCIIQLLIIYFGGEVFRCTPLSLGHLVICAMIAFTVIPFDMLRKLLSKRKKV